MKCPDCGHINRVGVLQCEQCSADLYEVLLERISTRQLSALQTRELSLGVTAPSSNPVVGYVTGHEQPLAIERRNGLIVGRGTRADGIDLDLSAYGAERQGVSRRHARLDAQARQPFITDLNSTNGTFVNETRLAAHQAFVLRSGDEVRLGRMVIRLYFK